MKMLVDHATIDPARATDRSVAPSPRRPARVREEVRGVLEGLPGSVVRLWWARRVVGGV